MPEHERSAVRIRRQRHVVDGARTLALALRRGASVPLLFVLPLLGVKQERWEAPVGRKGAGWIAIHCMR